MQKDNRRRIQFAMVYVPQLTIPSSIVRKAVSGNPEFLYYYDAMPVYSSGIAIEIILIELLRESIGKGFQLFSTSDPWISCPPDGFHKRMRFPIEIKIKGSLFDVIRTHYHQLQINIHCSGSDKILLIVYIFSGQFYVIELEKDIQFLNACLPLLEFAFYKHVFKYGDFFTEDMIEDACSKVKIF